MNRAKDGWGGGVLAHLLAWLRVSSRSQSGGAAVDRVPWTKQRLAEGIVDLVRTGVAQVLPFEPDAGATETGRQSSRRIKGGRPADVMLQQLVEPGLEPTIAARLVVGLLEIGKWRHQGFWYEPAAKGAKVATVVGEFLHWSDDST